MKKQVKCSIVLSLIFLIIIQLFSPPNIYAINTYDLVIKNGYIFNPSTNSELNEYNIGIIGDKIKRITKENITGSKEIDAKGKIVSPGFVDLISYDPNSYGIEFKVLEGVTTNLAMHGGTEDATAWYNLWEKEGVVTNYGASSFITRMRWPIIGGGVDDEITNKEDIERLVSATRKNIEDGALGISFSLEYVPGVKNEIVPLLDLAKEYDAPTFYHLRYSDKDNGPKGIEEVIEYARKTKASIHIMHINSTGGTFNMEKALKLIDDGLDEGLDITACIYPYDYWATYIDSARFRDGWQERFNIDYNDLQIGGTDIRISENTFPKYRQQRLLVAAHNSIPEDDNILAIKHPKVMIGSDTIIEDGGNNHPRGSGTYGRLFNRYVNKNKILTTMEAIKKASYLPAKRMEDIAPQMKYKGRLELESDADIVIFDLENFKDNSTVKDTEVASSGVEYVIINGHIVKNKDGLIEGITPGRPIKSKFIDKYEDRNLISMNIISDKDDKEFDNLYNIDSKLYLPIDDLFKHLKLNYSIANNGEINLADRIIFNIGDINYTRDKTTYKMALEPIIYEGNLMIALDSLKDIFNDYYEIIEDDKLVFKPKKEVGKLKEDNKNDKKEDSSIDPIKKSKKIPILIFLIFISLIAIILYQGSKNNKRNRRNKRDTRNK